MANFPKWVKFFLFPFSLVEISRPFVRAHYLSPKVVLCLMSISTRPKNRSIFCSCFVGSLYRFISSSPPPPTFGRFFHAFFTVCMMPPLSLPSLSAFFLPCKPYSSCHPLTYLPFQCFVSYFAVCDFFFLTLSKDSLLLPTNQKTEINFPASSTVHRDFCRWNRRPKRTYVDWWTFYCADVTENATPSRRHYRSFQFSRSFGSSLSASLSVACGVPPPLSRKLSERTR